MFQQQLEMMARRRDSTWRVLRVWMYVMSQATFAECVPVTQKQIGAALGLAQQDVSRALRWLMSQGVVFGEKRDGRMLYSLNSQYVFKGHTTRLRQRRAYQAQRHVNGTAAPTPQPV